MGFLERLFGKNADAKKEDILVLKVDGLENMLKARTEETDARLFREAKPILGEICRAFENIREKAELIEEKECSPEIPKRAAKAIHTSKPDFVHAVLESTREASKKRSAEDLLHYPEKLGEALASLLKAMTGPGRYLPLAYGEELEGIRAESKTIFEKKRELEALLSGNALSEIKKGAAALKGDMASRSALEKERAQALCETQKLSDEEARLAEEYLRIEQGKEYEHYMDKKKKLEEAKAKKEALETYAANLLTPLKRPLRTYRKSAQEKGLKTEGIAESIEALIEDPVKALTSPEKKDLESLLSQMLAVLEEDQTHTKDVDKSKITSRIRIAMGADLGKLRRDLTFCAEEVSELAKEVDESPLPAEKRDLERRMEKNKREIFLRNEEADKIAKKMERIDSEIKDRASKLEDALSRLEKRRIRLDSRPG